MLYQMSPTKRWNTGNINAIAGRTFPMKERIIVRHNLNSKLDLTTAVETLLLNNELRNSSSIFVIVPASDDEEEENLSGGYDSVIGIQLPENYNRRKKTDVFECNMRHRRTYNLKPTEDENEIFDLVLNSVDGPQNLNFKPEISNKLCQITTPYIVTNKLCQITTPSDVTNKLCQITSPRRRRQTRFALNALDNRFANKVCQVRSVDEMWNKTAFIVGTDTTIDRPCCCSIEQPANVIVDKPCCCLDADSCESLQSCNNRMITKLISPVLVNTEFSTEEFNILKQSSLLDTSNKPFSSISTSLIFPENENYDDEPIYEINPRNIYNTPMQELEDNQVLNLQSCQCTPEKLRLLLEQVLAEKSLNKSNVGCGSSMGTSEAPKHIRFVDIKCSGCLQPKHKNKIESTNHPEDCNCNSLPTTIDIDQTAPKITASTLYCLNGSRNIGIQGNPSKMSMNLDNTGSKLYCVANQATGLKKRLNLSSQTIGIDENEGYSEILTRDTHTQPNNHQWRQNCIVENDTNFNHSVRENMDMEHHTIRSLPHNEDKSKSSKIKEQIKLELIRTLSGFKYPQEPKFNIGVNDIRDKNNVQYPPPHLLMQYQNTPISSKKKNPQNQLSPTPRMTFGDFLKYYAHMNTAFLRDLSPPYVKKSDKNTLFFYDKHRNDKTENHPNDRKEKEKGLKIIFGGKG